MALITRIRFPFTILFLGIVTPLISAHTVTMSYADPYTTFVDEAKIRCSHDHAPAPFSNIYFCDSINLPCAGASAVFTWYAKDNSIDASYERAKVLFAPQRRTDSHSQRSQHPSTADFISNSAQLNMAPIWQEIHQTHHSAIAYALIDGESRLLSITQFEYLPQQLDNGIPKTGERPIHARQWVIMVEISPYHSKSNMYLFHLTELSLFNSVEHQGTLVDTSAHLDTKGMFKAKYPLAPIPTAQQSPEQRWLCQGAFPYYSQHHHR